MLRQEHSSGVLPLVLAFVNAATYFLQAYAMISEISTVAMAWFSLTLAAVYLLLNRLRPRSSDAAAEQNLRLMHLALAVGLVTVAIPIRLEAHWITIGWFVEAALLLWIGDRIKSELLNGFALIALVLGVGRLLVFDMGGGTLDIAVLDVIGGDKPEIFVLAALGLASPRSPVRCARGRGQCPHGEPSAHSAVVRRPR